MTFRLTKLLLAAVGISAMLIGTAQARTDSIVLGMGCFWGAEKRMSEIPGVTNVESGYAGGDTAKPTYYGMLQYEKMLQLGMASGVNHAEVVKVSFDDSKVDLKTVLIKFWENHNPTQGDRQGNDVGSNYRSAIYYHNDAQKAVAMETRDVYQQALKKGGFGTITTEIAALKNYRTAEEYHQDYLKKNPNGYCGLGGTKVAYPGSGSTVNAVTTLAGKDLDFNRQLVVFEAEDCLFCKAFQRDVLNQWKYDAAITTTLSTQAPEGWKLEKDLFATPTVVIFEKGNEVAWYTGYKGQPGHFERWLQQSIMQ